MLDFVIRTRYSICIVNREVLKMFRIPSFNQMNMTWDDAVKSPLLKVVVTGNILQGMEEMNDLWMRHVKGNMK